MQMACLWTCGTRSSLSLFMVGPLGFASAGGHDLVVTAIFNFAEVAVPDLSISFACALYASSRGVFRGFGDPMPDPNVLVVALMKAAGRCSRA